MKPANFLLRVESQSTSSTRGASAPSPSAAAAGTNSKIDSSSSAAAAGVAGEVDSAAAVSAALRLGVVAIDYGDHFDLAAMTSDVDNYAQQCNPTSASFKQPGQRLMQFARGCTPSFVVSRVANASMHGAALASCCSSRCPAVDRRSHPITHSLSNVCVLLCALFTGRRIHWPCTCRR